jgi:P4 family phage/plasmid primase-like protien
MQLPAYPGDSNVSGVGGYLNAVQRYREQGFAPVPTQGKDAFTQNWQKEGTPPEKDAEYWGNGCAYNIGVVLGKPSGGLVDIDRDCDLPERIEHMFLPDSLMSGREERPFSHSWYYCSGLRSRAFYDSNGKKFLEVRSDGLQTVVAPSVHPEGDKYVWHKETGNIATVDPETLTRAVNEYATALLLAIHMPPIGSRHDYALAAAGFLLRREQLDADTVYRIFLGAWKAQSVDTSKTVRELEAAVFDTAEKLAAGDEVKGGGILGDLVEGLPKRISRIWGWSRDDHGAHDQSENGQSRRKTSEKGHKEEPPTHDELRDRWLLANPDYAHGLGEWRRYQSGIWPSVKDAIVRRTIVRTLETAKEDGIKPSVFVLNSVHELARLESYIEDERWDRNPDILVAENGTIDIPTGNLLPHNPEHYATTRVPYSYDPDAFAKRWDYFIKSTVDEAVADFLQEFAGYCLTTDTSYEKAVWLIGPPGGGKSTWLEGVGVTLGERAGVLGLAEIEKSRFALAKLEGKTLVTAAEQPGGFVSCHHILNAIISGETISIERKYRDPYDLTPRAKIAWAMNELPRIPKGAEGLFRRVEVIRFPEIAEEDRDPSLKEDIKGEGAGILNWALDGLRRLRRRGRFDVPDVVRDATRQFRESNDIPALFVEERCIKGADKQIKASELYSEYKHWCEDTGHKVQSSTTIAEDWRRLGFERFAKKGCKYWRGVDLQEHDSWRSRGV